MAAPAFTTGRVAADGFLLPSFDAQALPLTRAARASQRRCMASEYMTLRRAFGCGWRARGVEGKEEKQREDENEEEEEESMMCKK